MVTPTEDGGVVLDFDMGAAEQTEPEFGDNLAEWIEDSDLIELSTDLIEQFEGDRRSREDWEDSYIKGLDLLGMKFENRTKPWDGACGVFHPMLAEAVVRFQAQSIQEVFPARGPAKVKLAGEKTAEKVKQGTRVQEYLNYLTCTEMDEYRDETEMLLFSLPLAGSAFRKTYFNSAKARPESLFVPAEDFVVSYGTTSLNSCPRATHVMKRTENEVRKLQVRGFYRDIELPAPEPDMSEIKRKYDKMTGHEVTQDLDDRHTLLEMQVDLDLCCFEDPSGVALPYVVTIDKTSRQVLSIYRNWEEGDPSWKRRDHFVHYKYLPGLGFYGFGLVHMIGGLSKSATSILRQLVDAGTLNNLPGGLKSRGLKIKGDDTPIMPGEFRDVDVVSGAIKDNISYLPYKEPSGVLYQLLTDLVQEGRRFASAGDAKVADMNGEAPVGTTLAILEREMKVLSAIQARLHAAMGKELVILSKIVKDNGPIEYPYAVDGPHTLQADFDERVDVIPVSDPNAGTMAQRIMQAQALLQLSQTNPQAFDKPLMVRKMVEALGVEDAEKLVPTEEDLVPTDPVSENENLLNGKPVKAFQYQDHEAHIQTHMSMAENPQIQMLLKKNPAAKAIMAAGMAHLNEHIAMAYRRKVEEELGMPLPAKDEPMPEDIELRVSRLAAQASAQLTGKAKKQAMAQKNAEMQKDPMIQMAQKELEIKDRDSQVKAREAQAKLELARKTQADRHNIEESKLVAKVVSDRADYELEKDEKKAKAHVDGVKTGLKVAETIIEAGKDDDGAE
jgi:hypothetical protein